MTHQLSLKLPLDIPAQEARFLITTKLYGGGRLSLGQAAELADYSISTFIELLGKSGISVFDYSPEDLEREMLL